MNVPSLHSYSVEIPIPSFTNSLHQQPGFAAMCDTVLFGLGLIFVVSLLMCALVQCSLNKPPLVGLSFLLTLFIGAFAIFGGSTFSVHYALWCDSLSQNLLPKHVRCSDAAKEFDRVHKMTDMKEFEFNLEVQQVTCWALFPLTFITALTYALALRWSGNTSSLPGDNRDGSTPSGFYQYVAAQRDSGQADSDPAQTAEYDERSPFIRREN
ncbi:hypothetical protein PoB_007619700 [Plakobranchus ocellatus]|uniref:Uncharacterized protein n=1 Tax=Plakobranchus ocellatus TaxID=259542 RepID=A0AAV4DZE4_9GAST|nr:hypothetical protein PoB_007619700 [Plakobranchus ocellatus]